MRAGVRELATTAAIAIGAAACGFGAPSSSGDAAGGSAVTLAVTVGGIATAGVPVYFQNADSTVVASTTTDTTGLAGANVAAGGYVTAIDPADASGTTELSTFAGVEPGDALHLDLAPADTSANATFVLTVPLTDGANAYQIDSSCGLAALDATGTGTITLVGCNGAADVVVMPLDDDGDVIGSLYAPGLAIAAGPITIAGSYTAQVATTFAYADVPATVALVATYQAVTTAHGRLFDGSTSSTPDGGTATNALILPATTGTIGLTVTDGAPIDSELGEQLVYDWAAWSPTYALDLAAAMLPAYATAAAYDPAMHAVTWTERAGGVAPDAVRTQLDLSRGDVAWSWRIIAPRGAGPSVAVPTLPIDASGASGAFDYNPGAADAVGISDLTSVALPGGYAALRPHGFATLVQRVAGNSGRMVVELPYAPSL